MKSSGSMIGGSLNSSDYQVFANYLVKFLQAYPQLPELTTTAGRSRHRPRPAHHMLTRR